MEFRLKEISKSSIPEALEKVERYRLLNEPRQAESICLDVLRVEPENHEALIALLLSLTDQVGSAMGGPGVARGDRGRLASCFPACAPNMSEPITRGSSVNAERRPDSNRAARAPDLSPTKG